MTEADKMFEELGYTKKENKEINYIEFTKKENYKIELSIGFDIKNETIMTALYENGTSKSRGLAILPKELKAINQKCKELGWL